MTASRPTLPTSLLHSFQPSLEDSPLAGFLFREGMKLFELGSKDRSLSTLRKAASKFKEATELRPTFGEAWRSWAMALEDIATLSGSQADLLDAKTKIEKAFLTGDQPHWDAAIIYQKLADLSGEIDDLVKALAHFEKSAKESMPPDFWNGFGRAYLTLADRVHDNRPILKAIQCYKHSLTKSLSNQEGWIGLGRSLKRLYFHSEENGHFLQAYDCLTAALQFGGDEELKVERIQFLIDAGRLKKEPAKLYLALEKCEEVSGALILSQKAEALALLGEWTERVELLFESEQKMKEMLDHSVDPFTLIQSGKCLYSFSIYYTDLDLAYQAIEHFQEALSLDRTVLEGWIWMGKCYLTVFDYTEDEDDLKNALRFFQKAFSLHSGQIGPSLYFEMTQVLIKLGEDEQILKALEYLEYLFQAYKSIRLDHPEWFFYYGIALSLLGELKGEVSLHQKALEAFINVLMVSPAYPMIHYEIGIVYSRLGEELEETDYFYRALHHFKLADKQKQDEENIYIDWALTWMTLAEYESDKTLEEYALQEAEQKLLFAAKLGNQDAFYHLACLYAFTHAIDTSLLYLKKAFATKTLPPLQELLDEEWLENLKFSPQFQEFLALLHKK